MPSPGALDQNTDPGERLRNAPVLVKQSHQIRKNLTRPEFLNYRIQSYWLPNTAISFYLGKKVVYIYRAQKEVRGSKIRCIWGKVRSLHGKPINNQRTPHTQKHFHSHLLQVTAVPSRPPSVPTSLRRPSAPHSA
ncbi:hypothetical protein FH972_023583 [Carpinus fangiana]|uniref:Uncharacterized protein n=1 Tax=Carpinus fangiana TaxID=176857 RepID=A0A5N6KW40_9ROSI|nr:hypothetical protein FH972_023583 [Carpinus fangiana]